MPFIWHPFHFIKKSHSVLAKNAENRHNIRFYKGFYKGLRPIGQDGN